MSKKKIKRAYEHFEIQKKVKHKVHKDKSKVIYRKIKHKEEDDYDRND